MPRLCSAYASPISDTTYSVSSCQDSTPAGSFLQPWPYGDLNLATPSRPESTIPTTNDWWAPSSSTPANQDFDTSAPTPDRLPRLFDDYMLGCLDGFAVATSEAPSRSTPATQDLNPHTSTFNTYTQCPGDHISEFLDRFTKGTNSESSNHSTRATPDHIPLTPSLIAPPLSTSPLSTSPLSTPPFSTSTTSMPSPWSDDYMRGYRDALDHARLFDTPGSHMPPRSSPSGSQTYETHIAPENSSPPGTMPNPSNPRSMETLPPECSGNSPTLFSYRDRSTNCSSSAPAPASQAHTTQFYQPPAGPESVSISATLLHCVGTETYTHCCDICGCSFRRPYLLRDHVRTHTGEKTKVYPCQFEGCTRAYNRRSNMIRHLKSHFPSDSTPGTPEVGGGEILGQPPVAGPSTHVIGTRRLGRKIRFRPSQTPNTMRDRVGGIT